MKGSNGHNRGLLRASSKTPPLLVIGLAVTICILGFNYWKTVGITRVMRAEIYDLTGKLKDLSFKHRECSADLSRVHHDIKALRDNLARKETEVGLISADNSRTKQMLEDNMVSY